MDRNPRTLLLLDRSEVQLFPIEQEMIASGFGGRWFPSLQTSWMKPGCAMSSGGSSPSWFSMPPRTSMCR
ncbi:MAG: hypothetical protein M5U12_17945 [Verrucomicrobia bacterium]|nr:hypothetical protein [Verrucomicrobiota bacterium]